jgi:16S rRNA (cytosine1402-N4)-methyltransferase
LSFEHVPVMRDEILELFEPAAHGILLDATLGLGGHAEAILERFPAARLVGIDRDPQALQRSAQRLQRFGERVRLQQCNFAQVAEALRELGIDAVDGALLDLGVSSMQIDDPARGFSYLRDGPLDMRMDPDQVRSASDLINAAPEAEIARVLWEYGEERLSRKIARRIVRTRESRPLRSTSELADVVRGCVSGRKPVSSLARVFQSVRMWVNGELESLREGLGNMLGVLAPGAIFAVLSYHSLEDRMVKQLFRRQVDGCVCPPDLPVCGCGFVARFRLLTPRARQASAPEVERNVRARSARLRALQRLP